MGGSASKTAISSLSSTISTIAMNTVQSCEVSAAQTQTVSVTNTGFKLFGNYTLQQQTDIKSDCFNDLTKQTDLQNKIIDAISQTTASNNVALLGAFGNSSSDATANLTNIVRNTVTMSNIQKTYNDIKQSQSVNFSNSGVVIFEQATLTQGASIFAAATLKEMDTAGIFSQIASKVDQTSTATQSNPLDFIAGIVNAAGGVMTSSAFLLILLIAAGVLGFYLLTKPSHADVAPAPMGEPADTAPPSPV